MMDLHLHFKEQGRLWLNDNFGPSWVFFQCTHFESKEDYVYSYLFDSSSSQNPISPQILTKLENLIPIFIKSEPELDLNQIFYRQVNTNYPLQLSVTKNRAWFSLLSESAWDRLTAKAERISHANSKRM